jgi:hypothetical protein
MSITPVLMPAAPFQAAGQNDRLWCMDRLTHGAWIDTHVGVQAARDTRLERGSYSHGRKTGPIFSVPQVELDKPCRIGFHHDSAKRVVRNALLLVAAK